MKKFREGDRVVVVFEADYKDPFKPTDNPPAGWIGKEGTVIKVNNDKDIYPYRVKFDDDHNLDYGHLMWETEINFIDNKPIEEYL